MTVSRLEALLAPFTIAAETVPATLPANLYEKLAAYLDLLLRWNARTNLTAIREPEEIVTRHFGEGIFTALQLRPRVPESATLLDIGSGAGFPGLPIKLAMPKVVVTLAESQGKKASFLREAVRVLGVETEVWASRVERMPAERRFDVVTLRAVDRMEVARLAGLDRLNGGGILAELTGEDWGEPSGLQPLEDPIGVPGSHRRYLRLWSRTHESSTWNKQLLD